METATATKITDLRNKMAALIASQSDTINLGAWMMAAHQADAAKFGSDEWTAIIRAMECIEAEMMSRGMTADDFDALFLATLPDPA